jgi:hypothetical protein
MKTSNEGGFSLLELTVAAMLTVGLIGSVFALLNKNQQVFVTESSVTDMNQSVRTAVDYLTRDIQSAGMGMARPDSSFAGLFYVDGTSNAPDQILIVNADPYAPTADLQSQVGASATFTLTTPTGITVTGSGSSQVITYVDQHDGLTKNLYQAYSTTPKYYVCYDDLHAMIFGLSANGQVTGNQLQLTHNAGTPAMNRTGIYGTTLDQLFSTPVDGGQPDYSNAQVSALGPMIGYRWNQTTRELERTEDLVNWYGIARGITDFQVQYRTVSKVGGNIVVDVTSTPADRRSIRSVLITIAAETPDLPPSNKGYRQSRQTFEVAPRNLNLLNNNNLSSNTKSTWNF